MGLYASYMTIILVFFKSITDYKNNPSKYKAKPKIPNYLPIIDGRNILIYEKDALNHKDYKKSGEFKLSKRWFGT